jgi:protein phosphatase
MKLQSFGLSDVGRKRSRNEDYFLANDELQISVVADGMGGHSGGEYASRLAVASIEEVIQSMNSDPEATIISGVNSDESEFGDRLRYAIEVASQKIYDQAMYDQELKGMGTTIAAVIAHEGITYVANVGDSRVYLVRGGKIKQVTTDHSLVSEQMRAGLISSQDAKKHKLKNIITRSVGYQEEVEVDVFRVEMQLGDRFVLCSDGLTNMIDDETIRLILESETIQVAAQALIAKANERGGDDNITAVISQVVA